MTPFHAHHVSRDHCCDERLTHPRANWYKDAFQMGNNSLIKKAINKFGTPHLTLWRSVQIEHKQRVPQSSGDGRLGCKISRRHPSVVNMDSSGEWFGENMNFADDKLLSSSLIPLGKTVLFHITYSGFAEGTIFARRKQSISTVASGPPG